MATSATRFRSWRARRAKKRPFLAFIAGKLAGFIELGDDALEVKNTVVREEFQVKVSENYCWRILCKPR
ncbi:MAG: hypothetical protein J0L53_07260 [Spirochaetes bacterium]|nr:hypothetical protein [Spirochaetota bacterium]